MEVLEDNINRKQWIKETVFDIIAAATGKDASVAPEQCQKQCEAILARKMEEEWLGSKDGIICPGPCID